MKEFPSRNTGKVSALCWMKRERRSFECRESARLMPFSQISDFFGNMRMSRKLLLSYLFAILLPLIIIGYYLVESMKSTAIENTIHSSQISLEQIRDNIQNELNNYIQITDNIMLDTDLIDYLTTTFGQEQEQFFLNSSSYTKLMRTYSQQIISLGADARIKVFTDNETTIRSEGFLKGSSVNIGQSLIYSLNEAVVSDPWYDKVMAADGIVVIGESYWNDQAGLMEFSLGRRFKADLIGDSVSVIRLEIPETNLFRFMEQGRENRATFLLNEDGIVISATEHREAIGASISSLGLFADQADDASALIRAAFSSRSMRGWELVSIVSSEALLTDFNRVILGKVWMVGIVVIAATAFMLLFSQTLTNRLKKLVHNMANIREGNFNIVVSQHQKDEIGELSRSFSKMVGRIDALISEVYASEIYVKKAELQKKEAELRALQSQINPHFLFNTMESLRMHLVKKNDRETGDIVGSLAKLFRGSLDWSNDYISLTQELDMIHNYLTILKFRFRNKLSYEVRIAEELLELTIPKFMLQPLVENAVQHGIECRRGNGKVDIVGWREEALVIIEVRDDGIGMSEERLKELRARIDSPEQSGAVSIGMMNVHRRIAAYYGTEYGLEMMSEAGAGTTVRLTIPLSREAD
jgi:two-component system sensor histidine kinase YesM